MLEENFLRYCQIRCFSKGTENQTLNHVKCQPVNVIVLINVFHHLFLYYEIKNSISSKTMNPQIKLLIFFTKSLPIMVDQYIVLSMSQGNVLLMNLKGPTTLTLNKCYFNST